MGRLRENEYERFCRYVYKEDSFSHWLWQGAINPTGYGQFWLDGPILAHRAAWLMFRGPIPDGLEIDHLCRVRSCVYPIHLEPVTTAENARRRRLTKCGNGHPYTDENTYWAPNGQGRMGRSCVICRREAVRRFTQKQRGLPQ